MVTCANCPAEAEYTYDVNGELLINYCDSHLPNFLAGRKASGQLPLIIPGLVEEPVVEEPVVEEPVVEEPVKTSKKKTADPVVEEPTVEEPAEEPVTE